MGDRSAADVCREAGIPAPAFSSIRAGKNPLIERAARIAAAVGLELFVRRQCEVIDERSLHIAIEWEGGRDVGLDLQSGDAAELAARLARAYSNFSAALEPDVTGDPDMLYGMTLKWLETGVLAPVYKHEDKAGFGSRPTTMLTAKVFRKAVENALGGRSASALCGAAGLQANAIAELRKKKRPALERAVAIAAAVGLELCVRRKGEVIDFRPLHLAIEWERLPGPTLDLNVFGSVVIARRLVKTYTRMAESFEARLQADPDVVFNLLHQELFK